MGKYLTPTGNGSYYVSDSPNSSGGGMAVPVAIFLMLAVGGILWGVLWQGPHEEEEAKERHAAALDAVSVSGSTAELQTLRIEKTAMGESRTVAAMLHYSVKNRDVKQHKVTICVEVGIAGVLGYPREWCQSESLAVDANSQLSGSAPVGGATYDPWDPRFTILSMPYIGTIDGEQGR